MVDPPPDIEEMLPLVAAYVAMEGNSVGGNLHIALDNGNLESHHLDWCQGYADAKGDREGSLLAMLLNSMDVVELVGLYHERASLYSQPDNSGDAKAFWLAVEETRFAGWGGHHETRITGYKREDHGG